MALPKWLKRKSKSGDKSNVRRIDYSEPIFFVDRFRQTGYDRELDEGMSSGMRRYATLDVTEVPEKDLGNLIKGIKTGLSDFNLCKLVQVAGFNKDGRRYIIVSGEGHAMCEGSTKEYALKRIVPLTEGLSLEYITAHITPPPEGETETYTPTNLGKYGSTGCPAQGIEQHPDAAALRKSGEIR